MRWFPLLLLLPLTACDPCADADAAAASVELGGGENAFSPVADGDSMPAEFGNQGGEHVWAAVRTMGLATSPPPGPGGLGDAHPEIELTLEHPEARYGDFGPTRFQLRDTGGGSGEGWGLTVVLWLDPWEDAWAFPAGFDPSADNPDWGAAWDHAANILATEESTLAVRVTDRCGITVEDERSVFVSGFGGT